MRPSLASLPLSPQAPFLVGSAFHADAPVASFLGYSAARTPPPAGHTFHLTLRGAKIEARRASLSPARPRSAPAPRPCASP